MNPRVVATCLTILLVAPAAEARAAGTSLRFYGDGVAAPALDRVVIRLDEPGRPVDVGAGDFAVEFWLKANPSENASAAVCQGANDDWIFGNIAVDRDVFGAGEWGDWGISLMSGRCLSPASQPATPATLFQPQSERRDLPEPGDVVGVRHRQCLVETFTSPGRSWSRNGPVPIELAYQRLRSTVNRRNALSGQISPRPLIESRATPTNPSR